MYDKHPLQVVATAVLRARIKAIAERDKISQAQVVREILEAGVAQREQLTDNDEGPLRV